MRILLADDEPASLDRLQWLLAQRPDVRVVGTARDGGEAATMVEALSPDLVLLDIGLPRRNGLSLARALMARPGVEVAFLTRADEGGQAALAVDPVGRLSKPVESGPLAATLARAMEKRGEGQARTAGGDHAWVEALWAPGSTGLVRVDVDSIDWIEAARDYALLHTPLRSHIVRATMGGLQRKLDPEVMVRISRSAFVRRAVVESVERRPGAGLCARLRGGRRVSIGTTYAEVAETLVRP